ncbi:MAG: hypothetical protein E6X85_07655, partial [Veillonella sp.]|nr:hypothetical protein [Veillonella sp.]
KVIFLYNFRCRTRIAGGFMIRDYVANQSKDNNKKKDTQSRSLDLVSFYRLYLEIVPNATLVFTVDTW